MPTSKRTKEERWLFRLQDARQGMASALEERPVYTEQDLVRLLAARGDEWKLQHSLPVSKFIEYLRDTRLLRRVVLKLMTKSTGLTYPRERIVFVTPAGTPEHVALSLRGDSYLSHLSAAFVHGFTDLLPRRVVATREQAAKTAGRRGQLSQEGIDRAFSKHQRRTHHVYRYDDYDLVLLAGQNTGRMGVVEADAPDGRRYPVSSAERTLIDCAVRPSHAGGIFEVRKIYEMGGARISVAELVSLLRKLDYIYPYHQCIGFLLECAGLPQSKTERLQRMGLNYDFYLDYRMSETQYSKRWRLHYPLGFAPPS